ncbi:RNA polymerase sigma factor SigJ [Polyangium fumosum]|uniref:Sigma-70 family RNA polymerase sigma factor n=1 Tax=Polyangium fumosum TaxID=889272 RepID=A0A4U1JGK3_9BACT|nr:RNA polymerase sigma factor SigJ [Polyangium fumosum]TKD10440.1 sigma-70 family RNA polymerase sigma factor [Polyangium fumosum]
MTAPQSHKPPPPAADPFVALRPRLLGIAYRMLGSRAEAEDVVQDTWVRWQTTDRAAVQDPTGFLVTAATRLAINVAQSARVRREVYVGPWLPEPIDTSPSAELGAETQEGLALAVLVLLEKLSPTERAAYVLREVFDYPHEAIAGILQLTEANVRQLVSRARKHLAGERRAPVDVEQQRRLLENFIAAAQTGDLSALERLLAADVASYTDSNGQARMAARVPVHGRERVAKLVSGGANGFWSGLTLTWLETNGQPSVLLCRDGAAFALASIDASAEGIERIYWVMNPEKLVAFGTPR